LQKHLAVLGDFVLFFSGAEQGVGMDAFQPDKHAGHTRAPRLLDEVRRWHIAST
jgi:hypothetical protein